MPHYKTQNPVRKARHHRIHSLIRRIPGEDRSLEQKHSGSCLQHHAVLHDFRRTSLPKLVLASIVCKTAAATCAAQLSSTYKYIGVFHVCFFLTPSNGHGVSGQDVFVIDGKREH